LQLGTLREANAITCAADRQHPNPAAWVVEAALADHALRGSLALVAGMR
jgi:hypothetical protein